MKKLLVKKEVIQEFSWPINESWFTTNEKFTHSIS